MATISNWMKEKLTEVGEELMLPVAILSWYLDCTMHKIHSSHKARSTAASSICTTSNCCKHVIKPSVKKLQHILLVVDVIGLPLMMVKRLLSYGLQLFWQCQCFPTFEEYKCSFNDNSCWGRLQTSRRGIKNKYLLM